MPFSIKGHKVRITSSIGIALFSPETASPEAMMMQADLALYGAKDEGRDCYRFHSHDLDREVHERVRVAEELRVALDHGELELYYQPQVELATGRIIGLEALIRWNHPTRGLLAPGDFIALAIEVGEHPEPTRLAREVKAVFEQDPSPTFEGARIAGNTGHVDR